MRVAATSPTRQPQIGSCVGIFGIDPPVDAHCILTAEIPTTVGAAASMRPAAQSGGEFASQLDRMSTGRKHLGGVVEIVSLS